MTRALDKIKAAKIALAEAMHDRDEERAESFNQLLIKRFGRLPKYGDIIVPASPYDKVRVPVQVVKIDWNDHPCLFVKEANVVQMEDKIEFLPIKRKDGIVYSGYFVFRTAIRGARFARPDEKDGSAYEFYIDYNRDRTYPTYLHALEAVRAKYRTPNVKLRTEQKSWGLTVWREGQSGDRHTISRTRKADHPF